MRRIVVCLLAVGLAGCLDAISAPALVAGLDTAQPAEPDATPDATRIVDTTADGDESALEGEDQ